MLPPQHFPSNVASTFRSSTTPRHLCQVVVLILIATTLAFLPVSPAAADPKPQPPLGATRFRLVAENDGVRAADVALRSIVNGTRGGVVEAEPFSMVGLTWHGAERRVWVKTRSGGEWSAWRELEVLHDGPDVGQESHPTATDLVWVGRSDAVRVRMGATPVDATLVLLEPDGTPVDTLPKPKTTPKAGDKNNPQLRPELRSRKQWGANPKWRRGTVTYNHTIKNMHVHHTVSSNGYSRSDVPGLLRGMYRYHTKSLGWNDIGYNFLVDRFGRTWVGRAGGAAKAVEGAHTLGFNSTSFGVAVIGDYRSKEPSKLVITALVQLGAWKLSKYDRDPTAKIRVKSRGSDKFRAGRQVMLNVIDGHRDTNDTVCPGGRLYAKLPGIRKRAADRIKRLA